MLLKGLETQDVDAFDVICKFDSDVIFPENYLEKSEQRLRNILITDLLAAFYILRKTEIGYMKEILINIMYADQ